MPYHLLADLLVILHVSFVLFVLFGGLLALRWRPIVWIHLPAAVWGAAVELGGWICPLTPLEIWLREQGGAPGYSSDFIPYYLLPLLYPTGLTREVQLVLGIVVLVVNAAVYGWIWRRTFRTKSR